MLEHGLDPDAMEARVGERQLVTVGEDLDVGRGVDIGADDAHVGRFVEGLRAAAAPAAADDQHPRRWKCAQRCEKRRAILLSLLIRSRGPLAQPAQHAARA